MDAVQPKAGACLVEGEQRHSGQQRIRAAAPLHIRRARARRTNEINALDENARRVLLAEQDHARHNEIHEARAERTRPAHVIPRIIAAADEIDIALSINLPATEKERVDAALCGAIKELDTTIGKKIV